MSENKVLLPLLADDLNIIQALSNRPNQNEPDNLSPDEFKAKFDKAANLIQEYINYQLIPAIIAEKVPLTSDSIGTEESPVRNVKEAILWLKKQIDNVQAGQLTNISIGLEHLTEPVTDLLNLSTPIISAVAPTNENHGVGKIWLHTADGSARGSLIGMYIKTDNNTWKRYIYDVLPVSGGGTGKNSYGSGSLLYGDRTNIAELSAPDDEERKYLSYENEKPAWRNIAEIGNLIERIKTAYGSYDGNAEAREIELKDAEKQAIEPKVLFIVNDTLKLTNMPTARMFNDHIHILTQGQKIERVLSPGISESSTSYLKECVKLEGSKLIIYHESPYQTTARCANLIGDKYLWTALY